METSWRMKNEVKFKLKIKKCYIEIATYASKFWIVKE